MADVRTDRYGPIIPRDPTEATGVAVGSVPPDRPPLPAAAEPDPAILDD